MVSASGCMECVKSHHIWKQQLHAVVYQLYIPHFVVLYHLYKYMEKLINFTVNRDHGYKSKETRMIADILVGI